MSDEIDTYVKTLPDGTKQERVVHTAADRVAAKFAGFYPKKSAKSTSGGTGTAKTGNGTGNGTSTDKAQDSK